jgi:hypothetical protein
VRPILPAASIPIETVNGVEIRLLPVTQTYVATIDGREVRLRDLSALRRRCRTELDGEVILQVGERPGFGQTSVVPIAARFVKQRVIAGRARTELVIATAGGRARMVPIPSGVQLHHSSEPLIRTLADIERRGRELVDALVAEWEQALAQHGQPLLSEAGVH